MCSYFHVAVATFSCCLLGVLVHGYSKLGPARSVKTELSGDNIVGFTRWMLFLLPNQQYQNTEVGHLADSYLLTE